MENRFFEKPILNSPYGQPAQHWELDARGQPTQQIINKRRRAEFITPIPKPQKRRGQAIQQEDSSSTKARGFRRRISSTTPPRSSTSCVTTWISGAPFPNPNDWRVTPETARLLQHWRHHRFTGIRPFFCQIEAVETAIWLTEVAPKSGKTGRNSGAPGQCQQRRQSRAAAARPEARHRRRQDHRHGHDHRLADHQCGAPPEQQQVHPRLSGRHPRHHHPRPPARAPAQRPGQLLRKPRTGAARHACRYRTGQDRHHQLPRLQAPRAHGDLQRRPLPASGPRAKLQHA